MKTSPIKQLPNNDYLINPGASFEMHLYNTDINTVTELVNIMKKGEEEGSGTGVVNCKLLELLVKNNVRCREIDSYVNEFRPQYIQNLKTYSGLNVDWQSINEIDISSIPEEIRKKAVDELRIKPDTNIEVLFKLYPCDDSVPIEVFRKYPFKVIVKYLNVWDRGKELKVIPLEHRDRKIYEKMVELNLSMQGEAIPLKDILVTLKLSELKEIGLKVNTEPSNKKEKVIENLLSKEGVEKQIQGSINLKDYFKLISIEREFGSDIFSKLNSSIKYNELNADLIGRTFLFSYYNDSRDNSWSNPISSELITGYEISMVSDARCCPYCKDMKGKKFDKVNCPKIPLHLACRCAKVPLTKYG
ncbi:MAG: hypothetical protein ABII74_05455 [Elusimicrobiota bacterium]